MISVGVSHITEGKKKGGDREKTCCCCLCAVSVVLRKFKSVRAHVHVTKKREAQHLARQNLASLFMSLSTNKLQSNVDVD